MPPPPARPAEAPRSSGHSTFTDKIRAVFYPSSQSFSAVPETVNSSYPAAQQQQPVQYQNAEVQPRPPARERFAEAEHPPVQNNREEMIYPSSNNMSLSPSNQSYTHYAGSSAPLNTHAPQEESGLDQLTRMLRESQPAPQYAALNGTVQNAAPYPNTAIESQETRDFRAPLASSNPVSGTNGQASQFRPTSEARPEAREAHAPMTQQNAAMYGNIQNPSSARSGLSIDPQEIQNFRSQIMQAARLDEAHERSNPVQPRQVETPSAGGQLRASPIQDIPFEQEIANRRGAAGAPVAQPAENLPRSAMTVLQPTQVIPQTPVQIPQQLPTAQPSFTEVSGFTHSGTHPRPVVAPETPVASPATSHLESLSQVHEASPQAVLPSRHTSGPLDLEDEAGLPEQVRAGLQQTMSRRPEVRTSDDTLLDIVKSLPPMSPAPQPPQPQPQVLNGRATRSLGSVLLEGHLVPQERLQVAQHVQRMMRGVDLNYQLGEILLMFKLLTPDQLLAASLVSYGMISTAQISALGRIRQELHAMGLEYDLESLLVLFRILTPEQLREVRASWSS